MAQARVVLDKDQFNCSICLDVLRGPATIPCGHSYCLECIKNHWDQNEYLGEVGCPQCRQSFRLRPLLARNTMLADVVERFKQSGLHDAPPGVRLAEGDDVACDVCAERKNRAVNSCLVCLASYCELHVKPHHESAVFKKHRLVSPSRRLQENVCPRHDKLLEVFCRTDRQCICYLCLTDEHKGHNTVLAEVEMQEQQTVLADMKQNSQQRIQQREKEAQQLRQAIFSLTRSARTATEQSDTIFTELIRSIELKRFEVRELIKAQEKMAVSQAEQLLEKIQNETAEQRKIEAELERLSHSEDHIHFFQSCQSLEALPALSDLPAVTTNPNLTFGPVMTAVSDFKGLLQEVCQGGFVSIYEKVRDVVIIEPSHPVVLQTVPQPDVGDTTVQMEPTEVIPSAGLDQSSASPLNPFITPGISAPTFSYTPFGSRISAASRQRHLQRRVHPRKK